MKKYSLFSHKITNEMHSVHSYKNFSVTGYTRISVQFRIYIRYSISIFTLQISPEKKTEKKIQSLNRNIFSPIIDTKLRMPRQISESNFWRETNTKDVQLTNSLYLVSLQLLPRALKIPWNLPYLPTTHRFQLKETGNSENVQ